MCQVCGRNVCVPKTWMHPPEYFRDNIRHLTVDKYERRVTTISCCGGPQHHHGRRLSSGDQPKVLIFSWPLWQINTIMFTNCWITNGYSLGSTPLSAKRRSNSLALTSLTFFCASVRSCTFCIFNGFTPSSFFNICRMTYCDMFSSQAIFRPLRRGFRSSHFFTFRTISDDAAFFRPLPWRRATLSVSR